MAIERKTICIRVEFDCEECGTRVSKLWHPAMPGRPRFCSRDCKSEFQRRAKPVTKEWLYQKYAVEGLDCTQIAAIVSRDPKSVWNWLKDFGIPRRPRGHDWLKKLGASRIGAANPFFGKKHSEATRKRLSELSKAAGRVPYLVNGQPWMRGRKGPLSTNWKGGVTPERQAFYSSTEWRRAARQVWRRDKRTCQRCARLYRFGGETFDIHHVVPFECRELRAVLSNLVLLCEKCHFWVHSRANIGKDFILPCPS
jgi:transposase-like protein